MIRWVQHKSGQGEKFEVDLPELNDREPRFWVTRYDGEILLRLPKSEYIECDSPAQWDDVTVECEASEVTKGGEICIAHGGIRVESNYLKSYRFRKIDGLHHGPAFTVERRKS